MLFLLSSHGYFEDLKKTNIKNYRIVCWNNVSFLYDWNLSFTEMCFVEFFSQLAHRLSQDFGLQIFYIYSEILSSFHSSALHFTSSE